MKETGGKRQTGKRKAENCKEKRNSQEGVWVENPWSYNYINKIQGGHSLESYTIKTNLLPFQET